jgi:hypothetical protein
MLNKLRWEVLIRFVDIGANCWSSRFKINFHNDKIITTCFITVNENCSYPSQLVQNRHQNRGICKGSSLKDDGVVSVFLIDDLSDNPAAVDWVIPLSCIDNQMGDEGANISEACIVIPDTVSFKAYSQNDGSSNSYDTTYSAIHLCACFKPRTGFTTIQTFVCLSSATNWIYNNINRYVMAVLIPKMMDPQIHMTQHIPRFWCLFWTSWLG